ncbi:MAG: type III-A CRISPR-associated RAMP protein Csm5 [Saprospiraceae bacterium]|nr:MAG: type III-A CRISPR-associated RAMP protein Csm5 [Saprospiraceae bacterium]
MTYKHYPFDIKITTLSPIHIGNGETLSSTGEYLTTADAIYFLKHEELMALLKKEGLFDDYLEKIVHEREHFDFYQTLKDWSINPIGLEERRLPLSQPGLNPASNNILHLHIKTGKQVYVPGSTFKGLIRHAVLADQLLNNKQMLQEIDAQIKRLIEEGKGLWQIKQYWERKERELLEVDLFKMIRCTDSETVSDSAVCVQQIRRQSMTGQASESLDWLEECIAKEQQLAFILTYYLPEQSRVKNDAFLQHKNPSKLFELLNAWSATVIQQEIELVEASKLGEDDRKSMIKQLEQLKQDIFNANGAYAIARIGKGKTVFFQTIMPLLTTTTRQLLIDLIKKEPTQVFPASRVLTVQDGLMKGWIKMVHHKPERKLFDNLVSELKLGTVLKAYWVKAKTVELLVNGEYYGNLQLINKYKEKFEQGEQITVILHQLTKSNTISQVKLNQ